MLIDNHVMVLIEERESIQAQKKTDCYACGLAPELSGGLCGDCLTRRHIPSE
jgi:hypothetical protein